VKSQDAKQLNFGIQASILLRAQSLGGADEVIE